MCLVSEGAPHDVDRRDPSAPGADERRAAGRRSSRAADTARGGGAAGRLAGGDRRPPDLEPDELPQRNLGERDDQTTAFPPHRVIGNIYYVGTKLGEFLVATPDGLILINSPTSATCP